MDPKVKTGIKIVALCAGVAVAPKLAPFLLGSMGATELAKAFGIDEMIGTAIGSIATELGGATIYEEWTKSRTTREAERNLHVSRALINAAADVLEKFAQENEQGREAANDCAKALRAAAKDHATLTSFFRSSTGLCEQPKFWEETVWPALENDESLDHFLWADFERELGQILRKRRFANEEIVTDLLEKLRGQVMQCMRHALATQLLTNTRAKEKLDFYFKTLVSRTLMNQTEQLVEVHAKLDTALAHLNLMLANQAATAIELLAGITPVSEERLKTLFDDQTEALKTAIRAQLGPGLKAIDFNIDDAMRARRRFQPEAEWVAYERTEEVEQVLGDLLAHPRLFKWFTLTGPGGAGKSRTARELARRLKDLGWRTAFYEPRQGETLNDTERNTWLQCEMSLPTLIVVDYASERAPAVGDMLSALGERLAATQHPQPGGAAPLGARVVVLLLERVYSDQLDWVKKLLKHGSTYGERGQFGDGSFRMPALTDEAFLSVARHSCVQYPSNLGEAQPWPGDSEARPIIARLLGETTRAGSDIRPLYAQFLGEAIAVNGLDAVRKWSSTELARVTLEREIDHAKKRHPLTECNLNLLFLACLVGGISDKALHELAKNPDFVLPVRLPGDNAVRTAHNALTSFDDLRTNSDYRPLLPDLLAEVLVLERLNGGGCLDPGSLASDTTGSAWALVTWASELRLFNCSVFIAKATQDFPNHEAAALLLKHHPNLLYEGHFMRGLDLGLMGHFASSCESFAICLEVRPDQAEALCNWGVSLDAMARRAGLPHCLPLFEDASEKFRLASKLNSNLHDVWYNWGLTTAAIARTKSGEEREQLFYSACSKYEHAAKLVPNDDGAWNNWGCALLELAQRASGQFEKVLLHYSLEKFEQATKVKPDHYAGLYNCGKVLVKLAYLDKGSQRCVLLHQALEKLVHAAHGLGYPPAIEVDIVGVKTLLSQYCPEDN